MQDYTDTSTPTKAIDEGTLLHLVEQHTHLYDCSTKSYKCSRLREQSWKQIAQAMNVDG